MIAPAAAKPVDVDTLASDADPGADTLRRYETVTGRLAGLLQATAPRDKRLPGSTDEAQVAGMVGLVGEYIGRIYYESKRRPHFLIKETNVPRDTFRGQGAGVQAIISARATTPQESSTQERWPANLEAAIAGPAD